ncbi:MAG: glutaredoxin 3 [Candidatus Gracilibacteria bacterium]|nr:glutaredoxin 3 [Candidatus Gracilibacteria bacterium]
MVTIYSKDSCPYCVMAKNLLKNLNIPFKEIDITRSPEIMDELVKKSRMMTVPQIFVGDKCLGGYDSINALHKKGELIGLCR